MVVVESFKHLLAKDLLHQWLVDGDVNPFVWRKPGRIEKELAFYEGSSPYYFEHGKEELGGILFVPDITVFHQGAAHILIEVVHKSAVSDGKLERIKRFFLNQWVEVWEIDAEEILRQVKVPKKLKCRKIWSN